MAVEILSHGKRAVFLCTTSDVAFGPLMGSEEEADAFLAYLPQDPRRFTTAELLTRYGQFVQEMVCECGELRIVHCPWCDDDEPLNEHGQHTIEGENPLACEKDPEPANERFQCRYCRKKARVA